ncbi:MAG: hypothetical protein ACH253_09140 [Candidatus Thiodiazotropha sp.]
MEGSILRREILPFIAIFAGLILGALAVDLLLHQFDMVWLGR